MTNIPLQASLHKKAKRKINIKNALTPYMFIAPAAIVLICVLLFPILNVIQSSFLENSLGNKNPAFVGLDNYKEVFEYSGLGQMLGFTAVFTLGSVFLHIALGIVLAVALNTKINKHVLSFFRVLFILPWVFTAAVVAIVWQLMLTPQGVVNSVISAVSGQRVLTDWLGDPTFVVISLLVINAWRGYPHCMISFLAALQSIPTSLYEAASVDGAHTARQFFSITLPQLKPVISSVALLDAIWTMNLFPLIWLTTGGGPNGLTESIATLTYRFSFVNFKFNLASALAVVGLVITFVLTLVYSKMQKEIE